LSFSIPTSSSRSTLKSIPRIFEEHGEETFRQYEREVVGRLAERENTVIATGGGLLVDAENMDTMKQHAMVFCLWASPESIWRRVKGQSHRPLLNTDNPKQRIIDLLEERKPAYSRSDMLINTEYRSARDVANLILSQFRQATRKAILRRPSASTHSSWASTTAASPPPTRRRARDNS